MHSKGYVHADIKGANILLGIGKGGDEHCYLVDFGLATHYTTKEYKPDPKNAHNGTIEYTSRDAHNGVATMRGDLEILGLNLVHWLGLDLPWESQKLLANPKKVQESKEQYMKNLDKHLTGAPEAVKAFMKYVERMRHDERPDYDKCRGFMEKGLKACGRDNKGPLQFELNGSVAVTPKKRVREASPTAVMASPARRKTPVASSSRAAVAASPKKRVREASPPVVVTSPPARRRTPVASPKKVPSSKRATPKSKKDDSSIIVIDSPTPTPTTDDIKRRVRDRRAGQLTVNNDITPKTSATVGTKKKAKKTYEFNFELDVSVDADVVVNVKRKRKAAATEETNGTPGTSSQSATKSKHKALSTESTTPGTPMSPVVRKRIARNVRVTPSGTVRVEKG